MNWDAIFEEIRLATKRKQKKVVVRTNGLKITVELKYCRQNVFKVEPDK